MWQSTQPEKASKHTWRKVLDSWRCGQETLLWLIKKKMQKLYAEEGMVLEV